MTRSVQFRCNKNNYKRSFVTPQANHHIDFLGGNNITLFSTKDNHKETLVAHNNVSIFYKVGLVGARTLKR